MKSKLLHKKHGLIIDAEESALSDICNKLQNVRVAPDISALLQDLYEVVDVAVTTEPWELKTPVVRYDLSKIDFARLRAEFEKTTFKNVVAVNLMEKIENRLAAMLTANPTRVDLYERYQKIVQSYNRDKDATEIQKVMDDLFDLNDSCSEEEKRYLREGLENEQQLAVFDLLQKDTLTKKEREAIKQVAKSLLEKLRKNSGLFVNLRDRATAQAKLKFEILRHLSTELPPDTYDEDEIYLKADSLFAHFHASSLDIAARVYH